MINLRANLTLDIGMVHDIYPDQTNMVTVFPQINSTKVEWLHTTYSLIGEVNELLFTETFNLLMQPNADMFPVANYETQASIVLNIPNLFWHTFSLKDLAVEYKEGYVMLGATPVFRPH